MSNRIEPIDLNVLEVVTGGGQKGDPLINDLDYLATSIKDLTQKTSGFSSTQMMLLLGLALQRNQASAGPNVVYVSRGRWW